MSVWESVISYMYEFYLCFFSAFRCAYCYFLNPARKTRPQAPRFPEVAGDPKLSFEGHVLSSAADGDDKQSVLGDNTTTHMSYTFTL